MNVKYCYIVNVKCVGDNCFTEIVILISTFSRVFNKLGVVLVLCFMVCDGIVEMIQIGFLLLKKGMYLASVFLMDINCIPEL